jgi:hypothetical protein
MRQCELVKGLLHRVTWLPDEFAYVGKVIDLKSRATDSWSLNWKVTIVYQPTVTSAWVREHADDHRHQREASDI